MSPCSEQLSHVFQAIQQERSLAEEHLRAGENARRARAKNAEDIFNKKRQEVQQIRQEKQLHRTELRNQQADEFEHKKQLRAAVKQREEDIREARENERARIEKMNEEMCVLVPSLFFVEKSLISVFSKD